MSAAGKSRRGTTLALCGLFAYQEHRRGMREGKKSKRKTEKAECKRQIRTNDSTSLKYEFCLFFMPKSGFDLIKIKIRDFGFIFCVSLKQELYFT